MHLKVKILVFGNESDAKIKINDYNVLWVQVWVQPCLQYYG